jgi:hypothetical protein
MIGMALLAAPALLLAQAAKPVQPESQAAAIFRVETGLALVRFQVVADKNRPVQDLGRDEIEIREDGVAQKVALFQGGRLYPRTTPIEIHLLFDRNLNVQIIRAPTPEQYRVDLLDEFPLVSIAVWGFSGKTLVCFTRPTRDASRLNWAMDSVTKVPPGRGSPVYRAMVDVARSAGKGSGDSVPVVVVVSHADHYEGDATPADALSAALSAGASLFPVFMHPRGWPLFPSFAAAVATYLQLGEDSGGRSYKVIGGNTSRVLSEILQWLGDQVRYDYVAGFYPLSSGEKKLHSVQIVLRDSRRGRIVAGARKIEH